MFGVGKGFSVTCPISRLPCKSFVKEKRILLRRASEERALLNLSEPAARTCASRRCSCLRRTGHPFTVSDPCGPSQKIESVFSASPETIRREPREFDLRRSVGNCRTWQYAGWAILLFLGRAAVSS